MYVNAMIWGHCLSVAFQDPLFPLSSQLSAPSAVSCLLGHLGWKLLQRFHGALVCSAASRHIHVQGLEQLPGCAGSLTEERWVWDVAHQSSSLGEGVGSESPRQGCSQPRSPSRELWPSVLGLVALGAVGVHFDMTHRIPRSAHD